MKRCLPPSRKTNTNEHLDLLGSGDEVPRDRCHFVVSMHEPKGVGERKVVHVIRPPYALEADAIDTGGRR